MSDSIDRQGAIVVPAWMLPTLLAGLLGVLGWIGVTLQHMAESLAVVVWRVDALDVREAKHGESVERRLETLETQRVHSGKP